MKVKIKEGMKFKSKDGTLEFTCHKYQFYDGDDEEVWYAFTRKEVYPLDELLLDKYIPQVDGKWINEKNEYIY